MAENPKLVQPDLVLARTVKPGDRIEIFPARLRNSDSFLATVLQTIKLEYGERVGGVFVPSMEDTAVIIKSEGCKRLSIGGNTAIKKIDSMEPSYFERVRSRGRKRITKLMLPGSHPLYRNK